MIHAASIKGVKVGGSGVITYPSRWSHCWGVFESEVEYDNKDHTLVLTVHSSPQTLPFQRAFIESEWFQTLVGYPVVIQGVGIAAAVAAHDSDQYTKAKFLQGGFTEKSGENLLTLTADLRSPADRFISAMRLVTAFARVINIPEPGEFTGDKAWMWPLVQQFCEADMHTNHDSICTFYPLTFGQVVAYCDEKDWDRSNYELSDIAEEFDHEATSTIGALVEILWRGEKEFAFFSEQEGPISGGYEKDDYRFEGNEEDDTVLSVMAPLCAKPSGERVHTNNVFALLEQHLK